MIFKRSLLKELVYTAFATLLALVGIFIAQRIVYYLGFASRGSLPNDAINALLGFGLLRFLPTLLSVTIFLAVLLTLTRWYRDSEMVVWLSSGLSILSCLRPVLVFSLPIIALIAYLSIVVTPWASAKGVQFVEQLEGRDELAAISPGVFKESSQADRVFFVESFDELGNKVKNIFVQSFQHQKLGIMVAQTGYRKVEENGDTFLVMENGKRYEGKPDTPEFSVTKFERYAIREKPAEIKHEAPGIKSTSSQELMKSDYRGSKAELHWRLAVPISALILVLLAIPLSFVDPRAGRSANLMMALLIYIIYSNLLSVMRIKIVQGKISTLVGMWPVHAIFLALAFYLVYRRLFLLPILPRIGVINRILKRP